MPPLTNKQKIIKNDLLTEEVAMLKIYLTRYEDMEHITIKVGAIRKLVGERCERCENAETRKELNTIDTQNNNARIRPRFTI